MKQGIPVVPYLRIMPPGPYFVGGTWMTLWEYIEPAPIPKLSILEIVGMINELVTAMSDFQEPLPALGAWRNVGQAADFVSSIRDDDRIARLLAAYEDVNERIESEGLYPAHGDAHQGNLLASSTGWQWIDFEDVSLMPKFWDFACLIGNTALFRGLKDSSVETVLAQRAVSQDPSPFRFALKARVIMSTLTNLDLALKGHGDLDFSRQQLARIHDFLNILDPKKP